MRPKKSMDFARIEIGLEKEAIKILHSFCQTDVAIESLEHFECRLRKQHFEMARKMWMPQPRAAANVEDKTGLSVTRRLVPAPDSRPERRILSGTLPQRMFRKASSTMSQPKFEKSMTISNLGSISSYANLSCEAATQPSKSSGGDETILASQSDVSQKDIHKALPNSKTGCSQASSPKSTCMTSSAMITRNFSRRDVTRTTAVTDGSSGSAVESTQATVEATRQRSYCGPDGDAVDSSRRSRKSEGIKQFVDFGIREVRKLSIGKRRGTMKETAVD